MAKEEGHEVLLSPLCYSDLQPIDLVWAIINGEIGRQYIVETNLKTVLERLIKAFDNLTSGQVQGCINKAKKNLTAIYAGMMKEDDISSAEDEVLSDESQHSDGVSDLY